MDTFQSVIHHIIEWGKNKYVGFLNWVSSPLMSAYIKKHHWKSYLYLLITPILLFVPVYSLLGSFSLFSLHFGIGMFLLFFALCTIIVFFGIPILFIYALFGHYKYWRAILISSTVIILAITLFWIIRFYQHFLPAVTA
ncbi:hypothetical protein [Salirhabdus sp. Marseille-P4669]|uniref:hypothetical protein n=1 Tax=Salirhabdus sp. Marseille-P4669 TaxID=2042310 RepID=UPI000C7CD1AF|nr:hypothetical protein [Salirhabdus sp. Marseille-P4669]